MRRLGIPFLIAGSVAVLAILYALSRGITGGSGAESPSTGAQPEPSRSGPGDVGSHSTPAPSSRPPLPIKRRDTAPTPSSSNAAPTPPPELEEEQGPPGTRFNTKNLHYGSAQLRAQIEANAPHIEDCVRTIAGNSKPSGDAKVTFILAMRGQKVIVEDTGVEREATTIGHEALVECIQNAARSMTFEGLPREAEAIIVTRLVRLDAGTLAENQLVTFSYIR